MDNVISYSKNMNSKKDYILDISQNISAISEETSASTDEIYTMVATQSEEMKKIYTKVENLQSYSSDLNEKVREFRL